MSRFLLRIVLSLCHLAGCAVFLCSHPAVAQDPIQPSPQNLSAEADFRPREKLPRIVYTRDKNGEPIPWVESFPWDDYPQPSQGEKPRPSKEFAITKLSLTGTAQSGYATIRNVLQIETLKEGQHFVPIRMGRCYFLTQPKITNDPNGATVVARFDDSQNGYELVVKAKADQSLIIEFETHVMLKRIGDHTILRMSLPRSSVSSLQLEVAEPDVVGGTADGRTFQAIESPESPTDDEASVSRFQVDGLLPSFEFSWQPKQKIDTKESFGVDGDINVSIDGLGEATSVATLSINSFNKPIEGFVVQLPKNTRWANSSDRFSSDEYTISPASKELGDHQLLQIVFAEPAIKPPAVRIAVETEQKAEPSESSMEFELASFNVLGAATQYGKVNVFSEGTWMLDFRLGDFARQSSVSTPQAEKTFDYSRPNQVSVVVSKQTSQMIVEPIYIVDLEETVVRLTAIYRCTRRGGRQAKLSIDMGSWIFQSLGPDPDNVVNDPPELLSPTNGRLDIPLTIASDRFEVIMMASLPIENGLASVAYEKSDNENEKHSHTKLDLNFPFPLEASPLLQSTVALLNNETIVAATLDAPQYSEISIPDRVRAEIQADQSPQCLRMRATGKPSTLPIAAARLSRIVSVDIETQIVDIDKDRLRIRQQMQWQVTGIPMTRALLSVNEDVLEFGDLEIEIDGQPVVHNEFPNFGDFASENVSIQVPIETRRLGSFAMTLTYDWAHWVDGQIEPWENLDDLDVDLILPKKAGNRREDRLSLRHDFRAPRVAGYKVSLHQNRNFDMNLPWSQDSGDADLEASSESNFNVLPIVIQQVTTDSQPKQFDELVDRAWFQTWYTNSQRSDRAVFRVQGGDEDLQISVSDSVLNNLTVWVDGQVTEFRKSGEKLIEISVDASKPSHVVELHYSNSREPIGSLKTSLPRIAGAEIMGQWYWHIVMPRNECMVTWPRNLTRAHHWDWSALVPRRESEMTLVELEKWSGAMPSGGRVLDGSSQYLFGAMGEPSEQLSVRTASLPIYVLAIAGAVLIAGLLLIYTKRPAVVLIALGITIFGLIFLNPTYASIAGQIAAFGVILVMLGQLLSWLVDHSPRPKLVATGSPSTWVRRLDQTQEPSKRNASDEPSTTLVGGGSSKSRSAR